MFLSPGGEKFAQLMCALASHVLRKIPLKNSPLDPSPVSSTNSLVTLLKLQVLKGHLHSEFEARIKITNTFQEQYQQYKQFARHSLNINLLQNIKLLIVDIFCSELESEYRELCLEEMAAEKDLCLTIGKSSKAESKKQAFLDLDNEEICLGKHYFIPLRVKLINDEIIKIWCCRMGI